MPSAEHLFLANQPAPFLPPRVSRDTLVLLVTSPPLVPSAERLPLFEPISTSPSPCLSGHRSTSDHWSSVWYVPLNTCLCLNQYSLVGICVSRDILVIVITGPPSWAFAAHLLLVERVCAGSSPFLSGHSGTISHYTPSRAFRGTLASVQSVTDVFSALCLSGHIGTVSN